MKLHLVLFASLFFAGVWITNYKTSHAKPEGRAPSSISSESIWCERHVGGFSCHR